jgi:glucose/arabinose dehydrogenase
MSVIQVGLYSDEDAIQSKIKGCEFMHDLSTQGIRRRIVLPALVAGLVSVANAGVPLPPELQLVPVVSSLSTPVVITNAGDGSNRLFIVEKVGRIRIVKDGTLLATPFLDIDPIVNSGGNEQGLLGLAFHPDYTGTGYFYVNYIDSSGDTVISRFAVSPGNPDIADPNSEFEILSVDQPFSNHNGGQIEFGPDGYLYIALGDGGSGGDPGNRAQNLAVLLGKMLRIDIDNADPPLNYRIPADNPFVSDAGAADEIWAYGLRNPWRFSFDRLTGDIFIGDVGQEDWEEIDFQPASSPGGENWGWRCYEGTHEYNTSGCGPIGDYEMPILEYSSGSTTSNCSVTGGYRYRGVAAPGLRGAYLYGDYCSGDVWAGVYDEVGGTWSAVDLDFSTTPFSLRTFGEDEQGNVYLASLSTVYVIEEIGTIFVDGFDDGTTDAWTETTPNP